MIKALFNNVIVQPVEQEESKYGNIVVPDLGKEQGIRGVIVSIGEGHYTSTGTFIKTTLKVGDTVLLPQMGATRVDFNNEEYVLISENQILAIIENE